MSTETPGRMRWLRCTDPRVLSVEPGLIVDSHLGAMVLQQEWTIHGEWTGKEPRTEWRNVPVEEPK